MQKITPCLWIDNRVEEAANYYARIFKGRVIGMQKMPDGSVLTAHVEMQGMTLMLLAGNPRFALTESMSFSVDCKDQEEVDYYWSTLTADGGEESMCGWLKDKYGLSWQIVPEALPRLLGGSDRAGAGRAMEAMMQMRRIDVAVLEQAYAGS